MLAKLTNVAIMCKFLNGFGAAVKDQFVQDSRTNHHSRLRSGISNPRWPMKPSGRVVNNKLFEMRCGRCRGVNWVDVGFCSQSAMHPVRNRAPREAESDKAARLLDCKHWEPCRSTVILSQGTPIKEVKLLIKAHRDAQR
jgi:hypothetical protein